jgi:adenine-specific DNA-methyltransferase
LSGTGQVFTPAPIARLMARWLLEGRTDSAVSLLDPGAGAGHLTEAVMDELPSDAEAQYTLIELDSLLAEDARSMLGASKQTVVEGDFIRLATEDMLPGNFSHAIMNPPYARLNASSEAGRSLRKMGRYVPNLYGAFLWLTADRIVPGGRITAIIPRSFFNGRLFLPLRKKLFSEFTIRRIHTFPDRTSAFARDNVLQETVIIVLDRSRSDMESKVEISSGHISDMIGWDLESRRVSYPEVLDLDDPNLVVRIPSAERSPWDLTDRSVISPPFAVSTGKVVAYRSKAHLADSSVPGSVPLVDSSSLRNSPDGPRPISHYIVSATNRHLVSAPGIYVVVNRFSASERRPRLNVCIADCTSAEYDLGVAFENHLNVVSKSGEGMSMKEAKLLVDALTHPASDRQFIELSGSTQVNASDLNLIRIPSC